MEMPGDAAVHGAGVDVDVTELLGEPAGEGAFAGGGGAVDGDDWMGRLGHLIRGR